MRHSLNDSLDVFRDYMHPYSAQQLWRLVDKARCIEKRRRNPFDAEKGSQAVSLKPAFSFLVTSEFEKRLKQLKKAYRFKELDKLKEAIVELSFQGSVSEGSETFRTDDGIAGCRLGNGKAWLVYGVLPGGNAIIVSVKF